jgi:thymidylate synthase (FAD)
MLRRIERAGRTCYKSEERVTAESAEKFVRMIMFQYKHHSVIEHESVSVRFVCDRGISHEIVRHRIASYSQESTRYCNYSKDKHGSEINVIEPPGMTEAQREHWVQAMTEAEIYYFTMLEDGAKPQIARSVLPNSLKTELVMTANLREWRHFFHMRCDTPAHPQIRELAIPLLHEFQELIPVIFEDLKY